MPVLQVEMSERGGRGSAPPRNDAPADAAPQRPEMYEDDVVVLLNDGGASNGGSVSGPCGIVLETAWSSDNEDDEDDDRLRDERDEEDDDEDKLAPGFVRVAWPDRVAEEVHSSRLSVVDRSFLHGDVVVPRSNPTGLIGTVREVRMLADVEWEGADGGAGPVHLPKLDTSSFEPAHGFIVGRYVTRGAMLGLVSDCKLDVEVAFGPPLAPTARCLLKSPKPSVVKPQLASGEAVHEDEVGHGIYFPGMRVRAKHQVWTRARWLSGSHQAAIASGDVGTVVQVRPTSVLVDWVSGDDEEVLAAAGEYTKPEHLLLLGLWENARWQVGDHVLLQQAVRDAERARLQAEHAANGSADAATSNARAAPREEGPGVGSPPAEVDASAASVPAPAPAASSFSSSSSSSSKGGKRVIAPSSEPIARDWSKAFTFCGRITRTYTSVRVEWQDGRESDWLDAKTLLAREHLLDNDFLPRDFAAATPSYRLVQVLQVDPRERMVRVKFLAKHLRQWEAAQWQMQEEEEDAEDDEENADYEQRHERQVASRERQLQFLPPRPPESFDESDSIAEGHEEWLPVFELRTLPHMEFCLGGAVVRVPGYVDSQAGEALPPDARLGHAGQVCSIGDGQVGVQWADGSRTEHEPDQLMIVEAEDEDDDEDGEDDEDDEDEDDEDDEEDDSDEDSDSDDSDDSDEDEEDDEADEEDEEEEEEEEHDTDDAKREEQHEEEDHDNSSFPSEWSRGSYWNRGSGGNAAAGGANNAPSSADAGQQLASPMAALSVAPSSAPASDAPSASAPAATAAASPSGDVSRIDPASARAATYASFEVLEADEDGVANGPTATALTRHRFGTETFTPENGASFARRVQSEWRILGTSLPAGIHVLAYESRIDLLSVLMVGPAGTPFQHALFQFDVSLPPNYPAEPPRVFWHSHGHRLNPNLYLDGSICLSLLNTWKAALPSQRWDPARSNLLQLLASLHGLVLGVSDPYYLEAGYDRQRGTAQASLNSHLYNETALVTSLEHLAAYLSNPTLAAPWARVVVEHGLSREIGAALRELDDLAQAWERQKKARFASSFAGSDSSAVPAASAESESHVDEARLREVMSQFAIRIGGAISASPAPAVSTPARAEPATEAGLGSPPPATESVEAAASSSPASSAPASSSEGSSDATGSSNDSSSNSSVPDIYQPSLAFVSMLARQTRALRRALDSLERQYAAQQ